MPASLVTRQQSRAAPAVAWEHLTAGAGPAESQMAADVALMAHGRPSVRLYTWNHAALTFGRSQSAPAWVHDDAGHPRIDSAIRPTGGGMAVHGSDVCVAVAIPQLQTLQLHRLLSAICVSAVQLCRSLGVEAAALVSAPGAGRVQVCLADPSPYAVMVHGKKVAGFALRRYPKGCVMQGSLLVAPIDAALRRILPPAVRDELAARAISLQEGGATRVTPGAALSAWRAGWDAWWSMAETCNRREGPCHEV